MKAIRVTLRLAPTVPERLKEANCVSVHALKKDVPDTEINKIFGFQNIDKTLINRLKPKQNIVGALPAKPICLENTGTGG